MARLCALLAFSAHAAPNAFLVKNVAGDANTTLHNDNSTKLNTTMGSSIAKATDAKMGDVHASAKGLSSYTNPFPRGLLCNPVDLLGVQSSTNRWLIKNLYYGKYLGASQTGELYLSTQTAHVWELRGTRGSYYVVNAKWKQSSASSKQYMDSPDGIKVDLSAHARSSSRWSFTSWDFSRCSFLVKHDATSRYLDTRAGTYVRYAQLQQNPSWSHQWQLIPNW